MKQVKEAKTGENTLNYFLNMLLMCREAVAVVSPGENDYS